MEDFNIHEELLRLQEAQQSGSYFIPNELSLDEWNNGQIEDKLNDIVDNLEEDPSSILDATIFDSMRSYIKYFDKLDNPTSHKFLDITLSAWIAQIISAEKDLEESDQEAYPQDKQLLEMYAFLVSWLISVAETKAKARASSDVSAATGKAKKGKASKKTDDDEWDWMAQKKKALDTIVRLLGLRLNDIWMSSAERDTFINMFTKVIYHDLLENAENIKTSSIKQALFHVLSICVKNYNHGFTAQTAILLNLKSYEHLSEVMAEFLSVLSAQFDNRQLTEDILREISKMEFNERDTLCAKSFSKFLIKLSEVLPKEVLKQMVLLQNQVDSESYTIRMSMLEVVGNLILKLLAEDENGISKTQIDGFFDLLQERFRDVNSYVRSKVLQVLQRLSEIRQNGKSAIPKARRLDLIGLVIGRLQDKSSNVRKNAVKLLTLTLDTHPFAMDERSLNMKVFMKKKDELEGALKKLIPTKNNQANEEEEAGAEGATVPPAAEPEDLEMEEARPLEDINYAEVQAQSESMANAAENSETAVKLQLIHRYYEDAIRFATLIESAVPVMCNLLASTTKLEVVEAMEFFRMMKFYDMQAAEEGIRRMVHLVWNKDTSTEDGKGVKDHLIETFVKIYFVGDTGVVVKNLVTLTTTWNLAELTSLEQLLSIMMAENKISAGVVERLWKIFGSKRQDIPADERRGALIILSMFAQTRPDVIANSIDLLLRFGLGACSGNDLSLAKYACIALQQLAGKKKKQKGSLSESHKRFPVNHPICQRLAELLLEPTRSNHWFGVAEQIVNTIYLLAEHPDTLCGKVVLLMAGKLFNVQAPDSLSVDECIEALKGKLTITEGSAQTDDAMDATATALQVDAFDLSRLLFLVGHIAIKQIVHLENIESEWKRRKASDESANKKPPAPGGGDDLDQVTGTTEDEFSEAIHFVREQELLFGQKSLLTIFGPIARHICANNTTFTDATLQVMAALALSKLMCVSAQYCEDNLQLLFTILERTTNPIVRSNIIIALGDMAVCFNSLIDQNILYLYNRLNDTDLNVKKNTLMVLTHLILNGMVKVKGQISEMAKCLEEEEQRISDLAKLFFTELSTKDNAVYNNLPDIISNLSNKDTGVDEEKFKNIMKFLFEFIKKDKQSENIVDKLCQRFIHSDTERQWRDIAFCLSLLPYSSDRSVKKLVDSLPHYQDKLHEDTVHKYITEIISKSKKFQKPEMRTFIEEFEKKIDELRGKCKENEDAENKMNNALVSKETAPTRKALKVDDATKAMEALTLRPESNQTGEAADEEEEPVVRKRNPGRSRRAVREVEVESADEDEFDEIENSPLPPRRAATRSRR